MLPQNNPDRIRIALDSKTLRLLKMAREALIYLSLAMHREEVLRVEDNRDQSGITGTLGPRRIESFQRPEASS